MRFGLHAFVLAAASSVLGMAKATSATSLTLFDFTATDVDTSWVEQSDPVRSVGMSKAVLVTQTTQQFRRAVFFALLNPQPNGAGFAGVRRSGYAADLSGYDGLEIKCRGQGRFVDFKVVLRHRGQNDEPHPTYEKTFTAPVDLFDVVRLPFVDFDAYYRGKKLNDADKLDTSKITGLGLQFYGGVYLPVKQSGPAALEMDWIKAYRVEDGNAV